MLLVRKFMHKIIVCFVIGASFGVVASSAVAQFALSGQASVGQAGAAEYVLPLKVPPGRASLQPTLSVKQSSHGGNGLLGVGWALDGLSAISRCPRTMVQDGQRGSVNYNSDDRYCLDGQRLMVKSGNYGAAGSEYRAEIDSYNKITAYGSVNGTPQWFKVWTKAGLLLEYGNTQDSRVEVQGSSTVQYWLLNRMADARGNVISYSYLEDSANAEAVPASISYMSDTGSGNNARVKIEFDYETRPDPVERYTAGARSTNVRRMKQIRQIVDQTAFSKYEFTYSPTSTALQLSRLNSIKYCASTTCLPALSLTYENNGAGIFEGANNQQVNTWDKNHRYFSLDIDGDGRSDLLKIWEDNSSGSPTKARAQVWRSDGEDYSSISNGLIGNWTYEAKEFVADVNGDGRSDFLQIYENQDQGQAYSARVRVWGSNGVGFDLTAEQHISSWSNPDQRYHVSDVNGDGRADIVKVWGAVENSSPAAYAHVWLSTGSGFTAVSNDEVGSWWAGHREMMFDVDGDGMADLVRVWHNTGASPSSNAYVEVRLSNGTGFNWISNASIGGWDEPNTYQPMDVNGDGLTDILKQWNANDGTSGAEIWLSTGRGFIRASGQTLGIWDEKSRQYVADLNSDGRADFIRVWNDQAAGKAKAHVWISDGNQLIELSNNPVDTWCDCNRELLADFGGTGVPGLIRVWENPSKDAIVTTYRFSLKNPYLAVQISNGIGSQVKFAYKPLTDETVYAKETATYPEVAMQGPMYVVSKLSVSDGRGGLRHTNYFYSGLKADVTGRGALGFRTIKAVDETTGFETYTEYSQTWPYTGLETLSKVGLAPVMDMQYRASAYACKIPEGSATATSCPVAPGNRYFPYLASKIERRKDLNGVLLSDTTTTQQYNAYGDPTQVKVTTPEGYSKTTNNTYLAPDLSNWILGRLQRSKVTSVSP